MMRTRSRISAWLSSCSSRFGQDLVDGRQVPGLLAADDARIDAATGTRPSWAASVVAWDAATLMSAGGFEGEEVGALMRGRSISVRAGLATPNRSRGPHLAQRHAQQHDQADDGQSTQHQDGSRRAQGRIQQPTQRIAQVAAALPSAAKRLGVRCRPQIRIGTQGQQQRERAGTRPRAFPPRPLARGPDRPGSATGPRRRNRRA